MDDRTCVVEDCDKKARARGLCSAHYERQRKASGGTRASAPCRGCGADIPREGAIGAIRWYCTPECRPHCSVQECDEPQTSRGWCIFHYTRWKLTGDPGAPRTRAKNEGACSVGDCTEPSRKAGYCDTHYGQMKRVGRTWPIRSWNDPIPCLVCGSDDHEVGYRRFCGTNCQAMWRTYGGKVPSVFTCVACGINYALRRPQGRRRHATTKICKRCRQDMRKHGMTVLQLAGRDGTDCGICTLPVDMELRAPDPERASVDHIIPRARGGSNEPENLQLAHLRCNSRKRDRMPT